MFVRNALATALFGLAVCYFALPHVSTFLYERADPPQRGCLPGGSNDPDEKQRKGLYPSISPSLKLVKLSASGEYADRCGHTDTFYELENIERAKLVVIYVHGWGHNARDGDADRDRFESLLRSLHGLEVQRTDPRHVVGIYVGWNGSTGSPALDYLTFWSRKGAADQVSRSGVVSSLIGTVSSIVTRKDAGRQKSQMVLVGHSFGARILFAAVGQQLIHATQKAHPGRTEPTYKPINGPADLVLLLNPAVEASAYITFDSIRRAKEAFDPRQKPLFMTIASDSDRPMRYLFPIGQWLGMLRDKRDLTAIGHYKNFHTHRLSAIRFSGPAEGGKHCADTACIVRTDTAQDTNPFWIVSTDKAVLDGHSGIWTPTFTSWLLQFIDAMRPE